MLGFEPKNSTVYHLFSEIDQDCSGSVDFDEFINIITDTIVNKDKRKDVEKLFRLFDDDRTGYITIENLRRIANELGENVNEQDLQEMIKRADLKGDGKITIDEFYHILTT